MWQNEIAKSNTHLNTWLEEAKVADKAYRGTENNTTGLVIRLEDTDSTPKNLNLFWTNFNLVKAAVYSRVPKPTVSRKFQDASDDVGRVAAMILQRTLIQQDEQDHQVFRQVVEDFLLPGLGQVWIRYEFDTQVVGVNPLSREPVTEIENQSVPVDYVYWQDFFFEPVRSWKDCGWVARRLWLSTDKTIALFGEVKTQALEKLAQEGNPEERLEDNCLASKFCKILPSSLF